MLQDNGEDEVEGLDEVEEVDGEEGEEGAEDEDATQKAEDSKKRKSEETDKKDNAAGGDWELPSIFRILRGSGMRVSPGFQVEVYVMHFPCCLVQRGGGSHRRKKFLGAFPHPHPAGLVEALLDTLSQATGGDNFVDEIKELRYLYAKSAFILSPVWGFLSPHL